MGKKLSEMSLEELWEIFPIFLTEPQPDWASWYDEETIKLKTLLPQAMRISHIGSTSLPSIWAKPIIDILVEVESEAVFPACSELLISRGYTCMGKTSDGISFNKGYTEDGFAKRVFHLHLRRFGDNDELYFRDYLMEHPEAAKEYEALKLRLWKKFEHNRDAYTDAKGGLIQKYTRAAKILYKDRY